MLLLECWQKAPLAKVFIGGGALGNMEKQGRVIRTSHLQEPRA